MLTTPTIREVATTVPNLHAFRITGKVTREDMTAMSEHMLAVFEWTKEVDMLLSFQTEETSEFGAGLSLASAEAQVKSLTGVRNYVVANAPGRAGDLVEAMGKIIPVEARAFDTEDDAIAWLRTQPAAGG